MQPHPVRWVRNSNDPGLIHNRIKDRAIIRANPYHVLEGALIAAHAVDANLVVVALKATFTQEVTRMRAAVREVQAAGWTGGVRVDVFEGPDEYLYGEETALLEVLDG